MLSSVDFSFSLSLTFSTHFLPTSHSPTLYAPAPLISIVRYPSIGGTTNVMVQTDYVDVLGGGTHYFMNSKVTKADGTTTDKFQLWNSNMPRNNNNNPRGCAYCDTACTKWRDTTCATSM